MIEKLTAEQTSKIAEYRERFFAQATSTEPADRKRAEKAARAIAEIGSVKVGRVMRPLMMEMLERLLLFCPRN
jgi:hypothetical protein